MRVKSDLFITLNRNNRTGSCFYSVLLLATHQLTVYHGIDSEQCNQSDRTFCGKTQGDTTILTQTNLTDSFLFQILVDSN